MKRNQCGAISGALIAVLGIFGIFAVVAVVAIASYISANNYGVGMEAQLSAKYKNNQNILAQYEQKIKEAAQVPGMQKDDFKEVFTAALQGRYGANGSKAVFQFLKEQNPQLDTKVYTKLQQIIEAGRNDFQAGQTGLLDVCRSYETNLGYFWKGLWLRIAGFPKDAAGMKKMCTPIVTDRTEKVFEAGKENGPISLR